MASGKTAEWKWQISYMDDNDNGDWPGPTFGALFYKTTGATGLPGA